MESGVHFFVLANGQTKVKDTGQKEMTFTDTGNRMIVHISILMETSVDHYSVSENVQPFSDMEEVPTKNHTRHSVLAGITNEVIQIVGQSSNRSEIDMSTESAFLFFSIQSDV